MKGYATVDRQRVAITSRRSTRGRELASLRFFLDLSMNRIRSAKDFLRAAAGMELDVQLGLRRQSRHRAVHERPASGAARDGRSGAPDEGDRRVRVAGLRAGRGARAGRQSAVSGVILNWNNKPARGYAGADDEWTWGSGAARRPALGRDRAGVRSTRWRRVVGVMNGAATQDLRLMRVWPVVRDVLARGTGTPRAAAAAAQVDAWLSAGGSRLDADLDGKIDSAGAADPRRRLAEARQRRPRAACSTPSSARSWRASCRTTPRCRPDGSSAYSGWWSYVHKDLRTLLARPVAGTYATHFCGGGDVARCAASLWAAIDEAAAELSAAAGRGPVRLARRRDEGADRLRARNSHPHHARLEQADVPAGGHVRHASLTPAVRGLDG